MVSTCSAAPLLHLHCTSCTPLFGCCSLTRPNCRGRSLTRCTVCSTSSSSSHFFCCCRLCCFIYHPKLSSCSFTRLWLVCLGFFLVPSPYLTRSNQNRYAVNVGHTLKNTDTGDMHAQAHHRSVNSTPACVRVIMVVGIQCQAFGNLHLSSWSKRETAAVVGRKNNISYIIILSPFYDAKFTRRP